MSMNWFSPTCFLVGFHAQDHAGDFVGGFEFDLLAADLPEQLRHRRIGGQIDGEAFQRFGDRVFRAVVDGRDLPAVEVLHDHALQEVVDLIDLEFHFHLGVVLDLAGVLEEADAGTEQHDAFQRQIDALGFIGPGGNGKQEGHHCHERNKLVGTWDLCSWKRIGLGSISCPDHAGDCKEINNSTSLRRSTRAKSSP